MNYTKGERSLQRRLESRRERILLKEDGFEEGLGENHAISMMSKTGRMQV